MIWCWRDLIVLYNSDDSSRPGDDLVMARSDCDVQLFYCPRMVFRSATHGQQCRTSHYVTVVVGPGVRNRERLSSTSCDVM